MSDPKISKGTIGAAIGIAALAIVVIGQFIFNGGVNDSPDAQPSAPAPTAEIETDSAAPDHNHPAPTPRPSTPVPQAAKDRAADGVLAYTQYSYRDPRFDAWEKRLAKVSTPNFMHSLEDTFGSDHQAKLEWKTTVVPTKRETRTAITAVELEDSGQFDNNGRYLTFDVTYETSVRSINTDGWTEPTEELMQWVTVSRQKDGSWLVNDIRTSQNRAGGTDA